MNKPWRWSEFQMTALSVLFTLLCDAVIVFLGDVFQMNNLGAWAQKVLYRASGTSSLKKVLI
jgi:hypothetical protein